MTAASRRPLRYRPRSPSRRRRQRPRRRPRTGRPRRRSTTGSRARPWSWEVRASAFGARGSDPDGDPLKFSWDFDDGTTDVGEALHHVFHDQGIFHVTLTVSDGRGGEAEDQVSVRARTIAGPWTVVNALHFPLEANIKQWPNSSFVRGTMSDGSVFEGHVVDPYGIRIEYWTTDDRCIVNGVYEGSIISDVNQLRFEGRGCRDLRFIR
jgi:hypothetical protein